MLYKPAKTSASKVSKSRYHKSPHQQKQQELPPQQQQQQQQQTEHYHHHRWLRLGQLLSSIGHLRMFGSQHSLASNGSTSGESKATDSEDQSRGYGDHSHSRRNHRGKHRSKATVSCQNLAGLKGTPIDHDDWSISPKLGRNAAVSGSTELRRGANRVAKWATGLAHLLADDDGVWVFAKFLRSEFSEENVAFWLAVEEFKRLQAETPGELLAAARRIERAYIGCDAPASVNLDGVTERELRLRLSHSQPDVGMFNAAQSQIFNLMRMDSYARFLKSAFYKDCLLCELESRPLPTPSAGGAMKFRSNDSLITPLPAASQPMQLRQQYASRSQAQQLDLAASEASSFISPKRSKKEAQAWQLSAVDRRDNGTYRSRQPSLVVAALDLDCGFSVC